MNASDFSLLIKLLMAHMVSDYFLQFGSWVSDKGKKGIRSPKLYWHILITFLTAWLFSGHFLAALFIGFTHYLIDLGKIYIKYNRFVLFIADQTLHTLILVLTWLFLIDGWHTFFENTVSLFQNPKTWLFCFAYGLITFPMSVVIEIFVYRWRSEITEKKQESLKQAGQWIGILERILVLTFILMGQYSAMGFLIATKAILRFKDTEIKQMEYVLIGTLMSLTPTILLGILTDFLLRVL
ncbi:DUF3307 domain-containing protein [Marinilongibacter aquaticus]|uniref:DUF3307 domain-containing protein n=1 Tax=Marinilongibacter aquaticus TaxID=2975157 RepID=UPI0021BDA032|nr:DUF3307 domain-containing protein [Marinilongibacter aquaticus]UBM59154.1 DUF3307 domain-containing protein [Marinilongibacter aquaticus]